MYKRVNTYSVFNKIFIVFFKIEFQLHLKMIEAHQRSYNKKIYFDYLCVYFRFWMAVPFSLPRSDVQLYWTPNFSCWQQTCCLVWNIYRFPQGFFTGRRQYPRIRWQIRKTDPLTDIPKL